MMYYLQTGIKQTYHMGQQIRRRYQDFLNSTYIAKEVWPLFSQIISYANMNGSTYTGANTVNAHTQDRKTEKRLGKFPW